MKQKNIINRQKFKDIKRFDHQQMEEFAKSLYEDGIKKGISMAAGQTVNIEELEKEILKIKGIGQVKVQQIMETIRKAMNQPGGKVHE